SYVGDDVEEVSDIAFADHTLVIGTSRTIGLFPVDGAPGAERRLGEPVVLPNPFASPVVFSPASEGRIIAWPRDAETGSLAEIDVATHAARDLALPFDGPLLGAGSVGDLIYTLARDGEIRVVDESTGALRFAVTRPGATCIAALGPDTLVVGRGPGGSIAGSLVQIAVGTGETVPLSGPNVYTGAIVSDIARGRLYSLGVDERGRPNVVLLRATGDPLSVLASEIPSTAFALDAASGVLYSAAGGDGIAAWENGAMTALADPDLGAVRVRADDAIVASVGRDSLVSLWDAASRRQLAQVATFSDGGWAAVMPDGSFAGSPTGREHVALLLSPQGK
ncbi:MAG TPA: hypothetical protein VHE79_06835, partial [Spirochaetia bacterium]